MIRQPKQELLNRSTVKTLGQIFVARVREGPLRRNSEILRSLRSLRMTGGTQEAGTASFFAPFGRSE